MRRVWIVLACAVFLAGLILNTGALLRVAGYYAWAGLRHHPVFAVGVVAVAIGLWVGLRFWVQRGSKRRGRKRRGKRKARKPAAGGTRVRRAKPRTAAPAPPDTVPPPASPSSPPSPSAPASRGGRSPRAASQRSRQRPSPQPP